MSSHPYSSHSGPPNKCTPEAWHAIKSEEILNQIMPLQVNWAGMKNYVELPTMEIYQAKVDTKYSQVAFEIDTAVFCKALKSFPNIF